MFQGNWNYRYIMKEKVSLDSDISKNKKVKNELILKVSQNLPIYDNNENLIVKDFSPLTSL